MATANGWCTNSRSLSVATYDGDVTIMTEGSGVFGVSVLP